MKSTPMNLMNKLNWAGGGRPINRTLNHVCRSLLSNGSMTFHSWMGAAFRDLSTEKRIHRMSQLLLQGIKINMTCHTWCWCDSNSTWLLSLPCTTCNPSPIRRKPLGQFQWGRNPKKFLSSASQHLSRCKNTSKSIKQSKPEEACEGSMMK